MKKTLEIAVVVAIAWGTSVRAQAEVYTAPLSLSEVSGPNGQYLSANFDFHTQFSSINVVSVSFTMPAGYEGTAVAGGYFSIFSQMWVVVTGGSDAPAFGYVIGPSPDNPQLSRAQFTIPVDVAQQVAWLFGDFAGDPGVFVFETPSPDFLFAGKGSVAFSDVVNSSNGFAPTGPVTESTTWQVPGKIVGASITISGTAVPEPGSFVLLALGFAGLCEARRKKMLCERR